MKILDKTFAKKKILVTGGTGSIGSEIVRQLIPYKPAQIRIYARGEYGHFLLQKELEEIKTKVDLRFLIGDIRDRERLDKAFGKIDIVFHTAALKHVPFCEYNPFEAIKTNVHGSQNVIDMALKHNIDRVIAISTDKAVYPKNIMGITKLLSERMIISARSYAGESNTRFAIVRFGNILESRGSVIPLWKKQIEDGKPVTLTDHNMERFFIDITSAVRLTLIATAIMEGEEIFVLKMPEKNIYKLAQETIKKYGKGKKIKIRDIGTRDGEKIKEQLLSEEEKELMIESGPFYIIFPNRPEFKKRNRKYTKSWLKKLNI
jgi:FlaA1/EpsC-like NDP-sugar epimerase